MIKLSVEQVELNKLFSDLGIDPPSFEEPQVYDNNIKEDGFGGYYQLPLKETSAAGKLHNVVPIWRRLKNSELDSNLKETAKQILRQRYVMYTEVPFKYNNKDYMARVEPHFREPGSTGGEKPEGWHKGVSLYLLNKSPWIVGTFTRTPFKRPVDPPGSPPRTHLGEDIVVPIGTKVYPIGPGVVVKSGDSGKGGLSVYIIHENGRVMSAYKHLSASRVSKGQKVGFDTVVGLSGDSGNAAGYPHLHYEVRIARAGAEGSENPLDYSHVDPKSFIGKKIGDTINKIQFIKEMSLLLKKYS